MLIILGGLPGTGKTTIARELARQLGAVHVRIDSIEEAILDSGVLSSPINDAGYRVGYAVAADNLRIGRTVIADSVNPIPLSRDAWVEVANRAQISVVEIEVTCSEAKEHQHRVERGCFPENNDAAQEQLRQRYPQYRTMNLAALPVIAVRIQRVLSWGALG